MDFETSNKDPFDGLDYSLPLDEFKTKIENLPQTKMPEDRLTMLAAKIENALADLEAKRDIVKAKHMSSWS